LEKYAVGQLPVHPQYVAAGTVYFAELQEPLDFGAEALTAQLASSIGTTLPEGKVVQARLITPLSSATAHQGDAVEAIVSHPLFDGDRLLLPQGSLLEGSVIQVHPAHRPNRNGELRIVFHELRVEDGVEEKVEASLAGVEAAKADDVKLDTEGGARATTPKTRYLQTAVAVALAAASQGDDLSNAAEGGAGGFRVVGLVLGVAVHSQPLGMAMGAFGASKSIYAHFIARGHDVVFPKDTAMAIGLGTRQPTAEAPATSGVTKE
jgi:hypothetical protein